MTLHEFNTLTEKEAHDALGKCCVSKNWIQNMNKQRPFASAEALIKTAAEIWYNECNKGDWREAFTGHPKIGDVNSLKEKFANTKDWAGNEQAKVAEARDATIEELAIANSLYEEKYGYIFIVSASGKSAHEMLAILKTRLHNDTDDEVYVAMNEQHKITVIRLAKLIDEVSGLTLKSVITTHALDTSIGIPANGMLITLKGIRTNEWKPIAIGITNDDGRIPDVLPPGQPLKKGIYVMQFNTQNYYGTKGQEGFYPEVSIQFEVKDDKHHHIPLLINPYGYATYRGS